ncbi:MAG: baseplate J/gp47 family protein [Patescibacteria group bacterium]
MIFKSFNDIVISLIDYLRLVQNDLDTKPGTVARDLFIDAPAQQISELYIQLRNISNLSSFFSSNGTDLVKLASNFGVKKNSGGNSGGLAVLTTNSLESDVFISVGDIIVANNGISYRVSDNYLMSATSSNVYKATATRLRDELNLASITDIYAIEVNVEALTSGSAGNIGPYSLLSHNISGISNVTNLQSFSGGSDPESDDAFRARILGVFSGSNTGTALGYSSVIDSVPGVTDSVVIVPGDTLLIRDGTQVSTDSSGETTIISEGTGGKVDIYVLGSNEVSQIDSFIYNDASGVHDPTNPTNDFVIGQRGEVAGTNISQRRVNLIANDTLPFQPIDSIISVIGSSSGANFIQKYEDSAGVVHGNYELLKDSGDFGGSPFGFDRLRWISDTIELEDENTTKGIFNGFDALKFSGIDEIKSASQDFTITNESAYVNSDSRSSVYLKHYPIRNVNRIINLTTGERYVVSDQNPDGNAGELNLTGNITISGNTLPTGNDILQVDYVWVKSFDNVFDFDNLTVNNTNRTVQDSIDWSFSNLIENEPAVVSDDGYGNLTIVLSHPIFKVLSVLDHSEQTAYVADGAISLTSGSVVTTILNIKRLSDDAELYNTDAMDGVLFGTNNIALPTDTIAVDGDLATIKYNYTNIFSSDAYGTGSFSNDTITLVSGTIGNGTNVLVNYIANVSSLMPENNISSLPAIKSGNKFVLDSAVVGEQPSSNLYSGTAITKNLRLPGSNLRINVGSIPSGGTLSILGSTIHAVKDKLMTVTSTSGFDIDLETLIKEDSALSSLPSTIRMSRLYSVEKVSVDTNNEVVSVDNVYDIINYKMKDNSNDMDTSLSDNSLSETEICLPETSNNIDNELSTGDILRVTFYYINTDDSESVYFSKNGEQITSKVFLSVDRIFVSSGFKNISNVVSGVFYINNFNQPSDNTVYNVDYNYVAPKENERITITYNYNSIIDDATLAIENVRPITADILVKSAQQKIIDASILIVLFPEFHDQEQTVIQNANNMVVSLLSSASLGTTIDASDIINVLYSVQGIDRVRILNFSYEDSGNLLSISANKNEYLIAGTVSIQAEER